MKIKKVLTALLAAMLLLGTLASCAGESTAITVQLAIYATNAEGEEDVIYDGPVEVDVESPTVLSAVLEAAAQNGFDVTLKSNDMSVASFKEYGDKTDENGIAYYWDYTKNGAIPDAETGGKAGTDAIVDGDVIVYEYLTMDLSAGDDTAAE